MFPAKTVLNQLFRKFFAVFAVLSLLPNQQQQQQQLQQQVVVHAAKRGAKRRQQQTTTTTVPRTPKEEIKAKHERGNDLRIGFDPDSELLYCSLPSFLFVNTTNTNIRV